jgi:predicted ATPase/transcriptional regulator with XRE-family HTH domain
MVGSHEFGSWLKALRKTLDLTQAALAQQVGCAAVTIKQFESGQRRPSRQIAELLATCLAIPADERDAFIRAARTTPTSVPSASHPATLPAEAIGTRRQLSMPPTPLIGREQVLALLQPRLLHPDLRLLTLLGPPGVGKTRLSIQLAASVDGAFADGVVFVSLAPVREADQVVVAIGRALGYQEGAVHELLARLQRSLREQKLLLVLDNFEHVLAAAPLVGELLSAAPQLKVLATSRTPLRLYGEQEMVVSPLALPPLHALPALTELADYPAIALFMARAQAVSDSVTLDHTNMHAVAELCHRLDGLPLAIELAAGRIRLLTPQMLLDRIQNRRHLLTGGASDLPARHQTLWNAIDWSYTLLSETERRVLRQLAVFAGGWTLAAAEAILEPTTSAPAIAQITATPPPILDIMTTLVSQSLVVADTHAGTARYHLLESIREYALDRLIEGDEEVHARRRHAEYYFSLAETSELYSIQETAWMDQLEREHENLQIALAWMVEHAPERLVQLADDLGWFCQVRGYVREGRRWLELAVARAQDIPKFDHARVLAMIGFLAREMDDLEIAQTTLEESLRLYQQIGDISRQADTLNKLSMVALSRGDYVTTDRLASQSAALFGSIDSEIAGPLLLIGAAAYLMHDYERSQAVHTEGLRLVRETGRPRRAIYRMIQLAHIAQARGAPTQAVAQIIEALHLAMQANNRWGITMSLAGLASAAAALGNPMLAARLLAATDALLTRSGALLWPVERIEYERTMSAVRAQLDEAMFRSEWSAGRILSLDQIIEEAIAFSARA